MLKAMLGGFLVAVVAVLAVFASAVPVEAQTTGTLIVDTTPREWRILGGRSGATATLSSRRGVKGRTFVLGGLGKPPW